MIRQAISCDVCGTEKKQTNHWFVVREHAGELNLSGWGSRNRSRAGSKHLCGQTCLHKLVDEFMARTISVRLQPAGMEVAAVKPAAAEPVRTQAPGTAAVRSGLDRSLTSAAAVPRPFDSPPQACARPLPLLAKRPPTSLGAGLTAGPVAVPITVPIAVSAPIQMEPPLAPLADEPPVYSRCTWRAEAWEREREREQRGAERLHEVNTRRRP